MSQAKRLAILEGGKDPLEVLMQIAADETQETSFRIQAAIGAAPYVYPKLSTQLVATVQTSGQIDAGALLDRLSDRLGRLAAPQPALIEGAAVEIEAVADSVSEPS